MSLRVRFFLLIIGTIVIPNILIMLVVWLSFGSIDNMRETHNQLEQYSHLYEYINTEVSRDDFLAFIDSLPVEMHASLLDSAENNQETILANLIKTNKSMEEPKITIEVVNVDFTDGSSSLLIFNRPLVDKYAIFRNKPLPHIFPFIFISVVTILSLFIIRSINLSLKRIEEATRRVAEGDFDFELIAKGNDSIASLTRSFDFMRRKVKEEYDRRSRFFMGVSHDLKTPLASISGYADAVLEGYAEDKETLDKYIEIIRSKSNLLQDRISHLIHFVKLETGDWQASLEDIPLKTYLLELSNSFQVEAGLYGFKFESEIGISEEINVEVDIELVTRSLENLMHNAFHYSYPESVITLKVYKKSGMAILSLVNRSEGIPKDELSNIFEPFYRGSKSRNDDGFGLGLANVAAVIKSHGWKITVESELKKETVFTIIIPIKSL